jgi:hypothetical protein
MSTEREREYSDYIPETVRFKITFNTIKIDIIYAVVRLIPVYYKLNFLCQH